MANWLSAITSARRWAGERWLKHDDRHFFHPELLGRQQTRVARDDVVIGAHEDRVGPAPLADRSRDAGDLLAAVRARVVGPRNQAFDRPALDLDVDANISTSADFAFALAMPDYKNRLMAL